MTLVEFLTARLDEDYMTAKLATPGPWHAEEDGQQVHAAPDAEPVVSSEAGGYYGCANLADGWHIARHDPARVLREVDAKRRIIAECRALLASAPMARHLAEQTLRLLALPYADHESYREEWTP